MNTSASNPLMGPNQVNSAIDVFASYVTGYLLPVICYVGHIDELFAPLQRHYPGAIHDKRFIGTVADVTIFDHIPHDHLTGEKRLSPSCAYIFILDPGVLYTEQELHSLKRLNAITLVNPGPEEVLWHIKSLLLVQSLSFCNSRFVFPSLLSVNAEYRQYISRIIKNVIDQQSCVVSVGSVAVRESLVSFLFGTMPDSISPMLIRGDQEAINTLPTDRLCFIDTAPTEVSDILSLYQEVSKTNSSASIMAIVVGDDLESLSDVPSLETILLPDLQSRSTDAQLLSYWHASNQSHTSHQHYYYSIITVNQKTVEALYCPSLFLDTLSSDDAVHTQPNEILSELINTFDRISMDSIVSEVERMIMIKLREQCKIVESASHAAGIPKVTYNKRNQRLRDRQSLLSLFAKS